MKLYYILPILLIGCGTKEPKVYTIGNTPTVTIPNVSGDHKLLSEIDYFLSLCKETGVKCSVYNVTASYVKSFDSVTTIGRCTISWKGNGIYQHIEILETVTDPTDLRILMQHELNHCFRFQNHTKGNKPHVMRAYTMNSFEYSMKPLVEWFKEALYRNDRYEGYEKY